MDLNTPNPMVPQPLSAENKAYVTGIFKAAMTGYVAKQMLKRNPYLPTILMSVQRGMTQLQQTHAGIDTDMMNMMAISQLGAVQPHVQQAAQLSNDNPTPPAADTVTREEFDNYINAVNNKLDALLDRTSTTK